VRPEKYIAFVKSKAIILEHKKYTFANYNERVYFAISFVFKFDVLNVNRLRHVCTRNWTYSND